MTTISIIGTADKRSIVYPLLYAANVLGSVLLVTDDTDFRRLIGGAIHGEIANTTIYTDYTENKKTYAELTEQGYDFLIGVSSTKKPLIASENVIKVIRDNDAADEATIRIGFSPSKEKNCIIQTDNISRSLYEIEINERLKPIKALIKPLAPVFAPFFHCTVKEMERLMTYKYKKGTVK